MKKVFIGLLVVAAGTGAFFLLRKKKNVETVEAINKEWIIGKWQADPSEDSAFSQFRYDFTKEGNVLRSVNDSVKADTSHYEWNKNNELVLKKAATDSSATVFSVVKLTQDTLQVQSKDSSTILFTKVK